MRKDVYKQFEKQMSIIAKDCMVTEQMAKQDPKNHGHFDLVFAKKTYYFNKDKVALHRNELKELIRTVPHLNNRDAYIFLPPLLPGDYNSLNQKELLKGSNFIETFFKLSELNGLLLVSKFPENKKKGAMKAEIPFSLRQELKSIYQEEPSHDGK